MTFGNNSIFPFNYCNNNDLIDINNKDTCLTNDYHTSTLPDYQITEQVIRVSNLKSQDNDNVNLSNLSSCKYYSCSKFHNLMS